jgi:hypothetical protein
MKGPMQSVKNELNSFRCNLLHTPVGLRDKVGYEWD